MNYKDVGRRRIKELRKGCILSRRPSSSNFPEGSASSGSYMRVSRFKLHTAPKSYLDRESTTVSGVVCLSFTMEVESSGV
jgi:hypothetical protein